MADTCILVADGAQARFFRVMKSAAPRRGLRLHEIAKLANPEAPVPGAPSEPHRLEQARRFSASIVERAAELLEPCRGGRILVIAEPQLLGLLREPLRQALKSEIRLEELARDYSALSTNELERILAQQGLIP